jgi:[ribosomal protein S5]-alanine N-acetyltransferase
MGLRDIDREHWQAEMGFWIGVDYWSQGYATEAGRAVIQFAFEQLNLNRVHAHHSRP